MILSPLDSNRPMGGESRRREQFSFLFRSHFSSNARKVRVDRTAQREYGRRDGITPRIEETGDAGKKKSAGKREILRLICCLLERCLSTKNTRKEMETGEKGAFIERSYSSHSHALFETVLLNSFY